MSEQLLKELAAILIGSLLFSIRKKFVRTSVESQNKSFGFSFGQKDIDYGITFLSVVSVGIVVAAIISMLKITDFRL